MKKIESAFTNTIYFVAISAALVLGLVSFAEPWLRDDVNGGLMIGMAALYAAFLAFTIWGFRKISLKKIECIIWVGIMIAFIIQLYIVFHMKLVLQSDLSHLYDQSVEMLKRETVKLTDVEYFGLYPNNIPLAIVIYLLFRLGRSLGCTDYRLIGGVFNVLLLLCAYISTYKILKRFASVKTAAITMVVILTNPVLYAYASFYYTDTISMSLVMVGLYFLIRGYDNSVKWKRIVFCVIAGVVMGMGIKIRVTGIFIILAIVVCFLLKKRWRNLVKSGIPFLAGFILFSLIWSGIYAYHVDFDTTDSAAPVTHFLMMGSNSEENGRYFPKDKKFTKRFATHQEKVEHNLQVWKKRVKEKGLWGNVKFVVKKETIVWCIGNKKYIRYTEQVEKPGLCYSLMRGKYSMYFRCYMQAYNSILLLMMALGVLLGWKKDWDYFLVLAVFWCGSLLFYAFWEANPRHSVSFAILMTGLAIPFCEKLISRKKG